MPGSRNCTAPSPVEVQLGACHALQRPGFRVLGLPPLRHPPRGLNASAAPFIARGWASAEPHSGNGLGQGQSLFNKPSAKLELLRSSGWRLQPDDGQAIRVFVLFLLSLIL